MAKKEGVKARSSLLILVFADLAGVGAPPEAAPDLTRMGLQSAISQKAIHYVRAQIITKQTALSLLPLAFYFLIFNFSRHIPTSYRPDINVAALPWLEETFFGGQAYNLIPEMHANPTIDLFAALGYGIHFVAPWIFFLFLSLTTRKHAAFMWCFGWLNALAVITQVLFPTAPPWYVEKFGRMPASYDMKGDPAGLLYFDRYFGSQFFQNVYGSSPVVFGSFPSLHAAWPVMIAFFTPFGTFWGKYVVWFYVAWVWLAALYLRHHFMVDIIGGALYCLAALNISRLFAGAHLCVTNTSLDPPVPRVSTKDNFINV